MCDLCLAASPAEAKTKARSLRCRRSALWINSTLAQTCFCSRFNTVGVSDAISMGTNGMSYSLQSRDLIADSIETTMGAQWYDANVSLPGCDKNMPGTIIAMGRLNRPAIMVYGGTIKPGYSQMPDDPIDIVSAFQSYGAPSLHHSPPDLHCIPISCLVHS